MDSSEDGNARRLYAEAYSKVQRHRIGMLLLQEALDSFNANMLDAKLADLGQPEVLPNDLDRVRVTCRLTVQVQSNRYEQVRQKVERVLTAIARSQGSVEATHRRFSAGSDAQQEAVQQLQRRFWARGELAAANFGEVYTLWNSKTTGALPDIAAANARDRGSTLFFVYSPKPPEREDAASRGIKSCWHWFEIDSQPPIPTQGINVVVRYTDQAGKAVLEERLPLGPRIPGLSASSTDAKLRTIVVSPFFLYHRSEGYQIKDFPHSHGLTLERKIIVPLTTLARVHTAKALAVGEEVERQADFSPTLAATPLAAESSAAEPTQPLAAEPPPPAAKKSPQAKVAQPHDVQTFRVGNGTLELTTVVVNADEIKFVFHAKNFGKNFDSVKSWLSSSQDVLKKKIQHVGKGAGSWHIKLSGWPPHVSQGVGEFEMTARRR